MSSTAPSEFQLLAQPPTRVIYVDRTTGEIALVPFLAFRRANGDFVVRCRVAGDADFSSRWHAIKAGFSRSIAKGEQRSERRIAKGERGIWQRRFWEHTVRYERDFERRADYIHYSPVKHGHAQRAADWRFSSFRRYVRRGVYPLDWGAGSDIADLDLE
jgi:putative transposase